VNLEETLMGELFRCARDVPGKLYWTAVNVPCQGLGSADASSNNASDENVLPLLASAANLLSHNSAE